MPMAARSGKQWIPRSDWRPLGDAFRRSRGCLHHWGAGRVAGVVYMGKFACILQTFVCCDAGANRRQDRPTGAFGATPFPGEEAGIEHLFDPVPVTGEYVMASLPNYLAAAKPVPQQSRAPWYKNTAPTYAGIMLWFVFWQDIVVWQRRPRAEVWRLGLGMALVGAGGRGVVLPFPDLPRAGHARHENRTALVRRRHVDLRRPRRFHHARVPHGLLAVRLARPSTHSSPPT